MNVECHDTAAIVIGRNEGDRLVRCLQALRPLCGLIVYVDSASTDGSVERARSLGAEVIELDLSVPFTAARARNAGLTALARGPEVPTFIQFIDGDCELREGWMPAARQVLDASPDVVAVCGRRRERHPQASGYNLLCDLEWDTPVGLAKSFGGDVLIRTAPVLAVGGYRESLIAGEEPELSLRLRRAGWKILRIDAEMCWHDAAIHRFSQWWKRAQRAGHAYAEAAALHGGPPDHFKRRECLRALAWGAAWPALVLLAVAVFGPLAWIGLAAYPAQILRLGLRLSRGGSPAPWLRATFLVIGHFAEAQGALLYGWRRLRQLPHTLIEYK